MSRASKVSGAGLGTHRRTGLSSQQVVLAPEGSPGPLLFYEKRSWIRTPAIPQNHSSVNWLGWWEADGKLNGKLPDTGAWTLGPQTGHNHYNTQPPCTYMHTHQYKVKLSHTVISYYDSKIQLCSCAEVISDEQIETCVIYGCFLCR